MSAAQKSSVTPGHALWFWGYEGYRLRGAERSLVERLMGQTTPLTDDQREELAGLLTKYRMAYAI